MAQHQQHAPACVYALADHLDAALAACEDLLRLGDGTADQTQFTHDLLRIELTAMTHVLQARQRLEDLPQEDREIQNVATLFQLGTASLEEAAKDKSPASRPGTITEDFLIGRRISLGTVTRLAGGLLDVLECAYLLYPDQNDLAATASNTAPATSSVWSTVH
jgi:hypothetical protein